MAKTVKQPVLRTQPHHEPGPIRAWVRLQWHRACAPMRWLHTQKLRFLAHTGGERARWWRGRTGWGWILFIIASLGAALLVFRLFIEFWPVWVNGFQIPPPDKSAFHSGYELINGFITPFQLAAVGYLVFLLWRMTTFRGPYRKDAIGRPEELVQTSGTMLREIVGRDDLCNAIMEDLRNAGTRRPHIIVADIGVGKTATLVRLTTLLAKKHAIPVPLRLRDYDKRLDFREAAYNQFCERAELFRVSKTEADRVWQQLCKDNKIVVLADGLEEALQSVRDNERDNMIRLAIHKARQEHLPVVVASRPHAPLRGMEASITELEPLCMRDALQYLRRGGIGEEDAHLQWIVETAEVSDSPIYLQITDELNAAELLDHISSQHDNDQPGARQVDRVGLRVQLLETWVHAVIDGYLHKEISLDITARRATVEQLSALACVGLMKDSLVVNFQEFTKWEMAGTPAGVDESEKIKREKHNEQIDRLYGTIQKRLDEQLRNLNWRPDLQLAVTYGQQLGLVEPHPDGARFPHSVMQAYLGSRYLDAALDNDDFKKSALGEPGKEFLLALVMCTRHCNSMPSFPRKRLDGIVDDLLKAARKRSLPQDGSIPMLDIKAVNLYTYAAQVIPEAGLARFTEIATAMRELLSETQAIPEPDRGRFEERATEIEELIANSTAIPEMNRASLVAEIRAHIEHIPETRVMPEIDRARFAKIPGLVSKMQVVPQTGRAHLAGRVQALIERIPEAQISSETGRALTEITAAVRVLAADARKVLRKTKEDPRTLDEGRLEFVRRLGEATRRVERELHRNNSNSKKAWHEDLRGAYRELFNFGVCEPSYAVRLAVAQEIGAGANVAYEALRERLKPPSEMSEEQQQQAQWQTEEEQLRDLIMRAWLAPMLVGSVAPTAEYHELALSQSAHDNGELARHVREDLEAWLGYVASAQPDDPFPISLKIALAQGFKQVANKRRRNPSLKVEPLYLAKRAERMLHQVDFWYSRLALLHALTLWSLPDRLGDSSEDHPAQSPDILVNQWMVMRDAEAERALKDREAEHPFVAQAAQLCVFALETRQPERFVWIDEAGVVSKTGSGPATTADSPLRQLWIPPSAGWSALDPRAQQLVADVLILLNLAEGGKGPKERERRLAETANAVLPSCLTGDRSPLDPVQTVGIGGRGAVLRPTCAPDCLIHLCPYPLKGQQSPRAELSEAFCRRQRVILCARGRIRSLRLRLTAPWQGATKSHLKRFWDDMGTRSRQ